MPKWTRISPLLIAALAATSTVSRADDESPLQIDLTYTGEVLHNSGGLRTGTGYLDDAKAQATMDLDKSLGIPGGKIFVFGLANNFGDFGSRYSGEFQAVSNIDTSPAVRLYEAWYEQAIFSENLTARVGLYDLNAEFDTNEVGALFINSSHGIGPDFSQTGLNGPSIFPVTSLAARLAWNDPSGFTLAAAVLDAVPGDPAHPSRTTIKLGGGEGALLVAEAAYAWDGGRVGLGGWGYTAQFDDIEAVTPSGPVRRKDNRGVYGIVSGRILGGEESASLDGFVRAGIANSAINQASSYLGAGLVATGLVPGRTDDQFGVSVAIATAGAPFRRVQRAAGSPITRRETVLETTYRTELAPGFALQPVVQYVVHPSFDPTLRNAFVFGVRFEISPFSLLNPS